MIALAFLAASAPPMQPAAAEASASLVASPLTDFAVLGDDLDTATIGAGIFNPFPNSPERRRGDGRAA
ncbi:MAG: hypothetical protein WD382_04370 [Halofilum sp. (in: g-proteobacteria)]